jgi:hypothetical protein
VAAGGVAEVTAAASTHMTEATEGPAAMLAVPRVAVRIGECEAATLDTAVVSRTTAAETVGEPAATAAAVVTAAAAAPRANSAAAAAEEAAVRAATTLARAATATKRMAKSPAKNPIRMLDF